MIRNLYINCPTCLRKFTVKDLDPDRPVIYCKKCNKGYVNTVITQVYENAVKYGFHEGKRNVSKGIKDLLGIKQ